jgi:hypothetical protein
MAAVSESWQSGSSMKYRLKHVPDGCSVQIDGLNAFEPIVVKSVSEIVSHFCRDIASAHSLVSHSCDKRFTPSTYLEEISGGYEVGWYDRFRCHRQQYSDLAEAATDYLLFSFGRGRLGFTDNRSQ